MNKRERERLAREAKKAAKIQEISDEWRARVSPHFKYLETEYGFRVTQVDASSVWITRMIYQTATAGVYVDRNREFQRVEVSVIRLLDGAIPPYPIFVTPDITLHEFLLDHILKLRAPHLLSDLDATEGSGEDQIEARLKLLAQALDDYAADVLGGDFSIFPTLEKRIKQRVQERKATED